MMERQVLQMKYHPAKKEIKFSRIISGKTIEITGDSGSVLSKYINKKGQFVLQDHGNQFFEDILEAFDGENIIHLNVITTTKDYDDFEQMVEYFNETSDIKITASLIDELIDMNSAYEIVKNHGFKSIDILKNNREKFLEIESENQNVQSCIKNFSEEIDSFAENISDKIAALDQNNVNICFSGPYSSGKSTLIDALIGYAILPIAIKPETAAIFKISSPKKDEVVRINFNITDSDTNIVSDAQLIWVQDHEKFIFSEGPLENEIRKNIQETINKCEKAKQHEQVYEILKKLNEEDKVGRFIEVFFPISLDTDSVQVTIYDTPGTDSGILEHKKILKDALSEQTHSILVFVTYPNGLNGGGNRALLEYLSELDSKEKKAAIDLSRSLFVINYADSLKNPVDFKIICQGSISNKQESQRSEEDKCDDNLITINLKDKKVFFTSAIYGYLAAATRNGIATDSEKRTIAFDSPKVFDDELGKFYQHNKCATSEIVTRRIISNSDTKFENYEKSNYQSGMLWVASGLYALQSALIDYGEKYAAAVKASTIINSVDKALERLNINALMIERTNTGEIGILEKEIDTIRSNVSQGILTAKKEYEIKNNKLSDETNAMLGLDGVSLTTQLNKPIEAIIDDELTEKGWLKFIKEKNSLTDKDIRTIDQKISNVMDNYEKHFEIESVKCLENVRDQFIGKVRKIISENGKLSNDAKEYILKINTPEIPKFQREQKIDKLYKSHIKDKGFWIFKWKDLNKKDFKNAVNNELLSEARELTDKYREVYSNRLNSIVYAVEKEFISNLENYSATLKAKIEAKQEMEDLKNKLVETIEQLSMCQKQLNTLIWETKK